MSRKKRDIDIVIDLYNRKSGFLSFTRVVFPIILFAFITFILYRLGGEAIISAIITVIVAPFAIYYGFSEKWRVIVAYIVIFETMLFIIIGPEWSFILLFFLPFVFYSMRDFGIIYAFLLGLYIIVFIVNAPKGEIFASKDKFIHLVIHGKDYEPPCENINIKTGYALYEKPTYASKKIRNLKENENVCIKEVKNDFIFSEGNVTGWINKDLNNNNLKCIYYLTTSKLKIRKKPKINSEQIGILNKNEKICIVSETSNWSYFKDKGWVSTKFIRKKSQ